MNYSSLAANDLLSLCAHGDAEGWAEFVRRFHPLIASMVLRVARQWREASPQVVEDLVQETYLKLCANRSEFLQKFQSAHENALFGYIKVFTANLAHDHFRSGRAQKRDSTVTESLTMNQQGRETSAARSDPDPDRSILIQQIAACLRVITPGAKGDRDRRIFWLYYRFGLSAGAIAALPSVALSTKGVETILLRLNRQIRDRLTDRPRMEPLSADPEAGNRPAESF